MLYLFKYLSLSGLLLSFVKLPLIFSFLNPLRHPIRVNTLNKLHQKAIEGNFDEVESWHKDNGPSSVNTKDQLQWGRGWFPVTPLYTVDPKHPFQVTIGGYKYVVWQNPLEKNNLKTKGWNVMNDACPHKFAPLSEGRVDKKSGCLECPYHGWQFESATGACSLIPQRSLDRIEQDDKVKAPALGSYEVHLTHNMLWAYLPIFGSTKSYPALPEDVIPEYNSWMPDPFQRELPYSFDIAAENFMDPAHIPFAHHSLQGSRSDAIPIEMRTLTDLSNETHCEVWYRDRVVGRMREGVVSFTPPCHYHFRVNEGFNSTKRLLITMVPVSPGRTRVFISSGFTRNFPFKNFPVWFIHSFTNRFLDTDLWLYDQEKFIREPQNAFDPSSSRSENMSSDILLGPRADNSPRYALMSASDKSTILWRKWWRKHLAHIPAFGPSESIPSLTDVQRRDRYTDHTANCIHCQKALKQAKVIRAVAPLLSLGVVFHVKGMLPRLAGVGIFFLLNKVADGMTKAVLGAERGESLSAARIP